MRVDIASSLLTVSGTVTKFFLVIKFFTSSLGLSANLTSLFVIIPKRTPSALITGKPETPCIFFKAKISFNVSCGLTVIGLTTIPDSKRLTISISLTCSSILLFL